MNEAVKHLEHHAANIDDYRVYERDSNSSLFLFKKKHQSDPDIKKMHYIARKCYEVSINERY